MKLKKCTRIFTLTVHFLTHVNSKPEGVCLVEQISDTDLGLYAWEGTNNDFGKEG